MILYINGLGSDRVLIKPGPNLDPVRVFFFFFKTLMGRAGLDTRGSGPNCHA